MYVPPLNKPYSHPADLHIGHTDSFAYCYERNGYVVWQKSSDTKVSFIIAKAPSKKHLTVNEFRPGTVLQDFQTEAEAKQALERWATRRPHPESVFNQLDLRLES